MTFPQLPASCVEPVAICDDTGQGFVLGWPPVIASAVLLIVVLAAAGLIIRSLVRQRRATADERTRD